MSARATRRCPGADCPGEPSEDLTTRATRDPPAVPAPKTPPPPPIPARDRYRERNCCSSSGPHRQRRKRKCNVPEDSTRRRETRRPKKENCGGTTFRGRPKDGSWLAEGGRRQTLRGALHLEPRPAPAAAPWGAASQPSVRPALVIPWVSEPRVQRTTEFTRRQWWRCGMVPAPWFGTKARNNTFILVIPESLRRPTPEAPGTASSDWPNGIALGWESQWLVRLLILKDDRAGDFSDVFSARTLFCWDQQPLRAGTDSDPARNALAFLCCRKKSFPWGMPVLLFSWSIALPFQGSAHSHLSGELECPSAYKARYIFRVWISLLSWRLSFQYDPTKAPEAQFFYLTKLGSSMLHAFPQRTCSLPQHPTGIHSAYTTHSVLCLGGCCIGHTLLSSVKSL